MVMTMEQGVIDSRFMERSHWKGLKKSLKTNKLCAKCAQPTKLDPDCANGACNNIKRDCFYCGSPSHLNILCDVPRSNMTGGISGVGHDEKEPHPIQD